MLVDFRRCLTRHQETGFPHGRPTSTFYLHGRGIIHKDIKLGVLLLTTDETVKISSFRVAEVCYYMCVCVCVWLLISIAISHVYMYTLICILNTRIHHNYRSWTSRRGVTGVPHVRVAPPSYHQRLFWGTTHGQDSRLTYGQLHLKPVRGEGPSKYLNNNHHYVVSLGFTSLLASSPLRERISTSCMVLYPQEF